MADLRAIQILRVSNNASESAKIIELTPEIAQNRVDKDWWNAPHLFTNSTHEGDSHWKWEYLARAFASQILSGCVAVVSQEDYLEGAMAYRLDAKSKLEIGAGCLYVDRLASAPRNRRWLVDHPVYKGVGTELIYWAVIESYQAGLGGRISLASLPSNRTRQFYEHIGFVRTNASQPLTQLVDYELPASNAIAWLNRRGDL